MGHNDFDQDIQQSDGSPWPDCPEGEAATTAMVRLRARLFAGRLDRELDAGAVPMPGSALAAHVARLTTVDEREALARALRHAMAEAHHAAAGVPLRIPVNWESMLPCRDVVDDITLRLHSPRPVRARGGARLRILLSDGTGPLYQ